MVLSTDVSGDGKGERDEDDEDEEPLDERESLKVLRLGGGWRDIDRSMFWGVKGGT